MKPYIGVTLDHESSGEYSEYPWYALRQNYFEAIAKAGGIPIAIPYHISFVEKYLDLIQGLIIPGGFFDIDPSFFGRESKHETVVTKTYRTQFDLKIAESALDRNLPFLGICAGEQLLNVVRKGTLIQHIPDEIPDSLNHEQTEPKHQTTHQITIEPGTLLHDIAGSLTAMVNTTHHQAVKNLGQGITINARASDGVIEGIEDPSHRFCLGVQWHPEYQATSLDQKIFHRFVQEAGALL